MLLAVVSPTPNTPVGQTITIPGTEENVREGFDWLAWTQEEIISFIKDTEDPDFEYSPEQKRAQEILEEYDLDVDRKGKGKAGWVEWWVKATLYSYAYTKGPKMHLSSPEIQEYEESAFSSRGAGGGPVVI